MGYGTRVFIVGEDDSIRKIPLTRFERLRDSDPQEKMVEYATKRLRYALAIVEMNARTVISVIQIKYGYLSFDSEGRLDTQYLDDERCLLFRSIPPLPGDDESSNIIDLQDKFAARMFSHEFAWLPDQKVKTSLYDVIFGV